MGGAPAGVKTGAVYPCCIAIGAAIASTNKVEITFLPAAKNSQEMYKLDKGFYMDMSK